MNTSISDFDLDFSNIKYYIFPMAYCNGSLHIGHLYVLNTLYCAYSMNYSPENKLIFPYHVSGLPATLFFDKYLKNEDSAKKVVSEFTSKNLETIEQWFNVVRDCNNGLLASLEYPISFENCHFTATLEPNYNTLVLFVINYLESKNLLVEDTYNTLFCSDCNNTVGDHELTQPVRIISKVLYSVNYENFIYFNEGSCYYSNVLQKYVVCNEICYLSLKNKYDLKFSNLEIPDFLKNLEKTDSQNYDILTALTFCRCGCKISIKKLLQTFVKYDDPFWHTKTLEYVKNCKLDNLLKNHILHAIKSMHKWPLFRSRGIGTVYKEKIVDCLSDSTLFQIYSIVHSTIKHVIVNANFWSDILLNTNISIFKEQVKIAKALLIYDLLEITGKDLVPNHITFSYYFYALFDLRLNVRAVGHILLKGEKMSKSKQNILTVKDLIQMYKPLEIKYLLATSAQNEDDGDLDISKIKQKIKGFNELITCLDNLRGFKNGCPYYDYATKKAIQDLQKYAKTLSFRSFYNAALKHALLLKKVELSLDILEYFVILIKKPLDHRYILPKTNVIFEKDDYFENFGNYLVDLNKNIKKWFKDPKKTKLTVIININDIYGLEILKKPEQYVFVKNVQFIKQSHDYAYPLFKYI